MSSCHVRVVTRAWVSHVIQLEHFCNLLSPLYLLVLLQVTSIDLGPDHAYTGSVDDVIRVWDLRKENSVVYEVCDWVDRMVCQPVLPSNEVFCLLPS